MSNISQFFGSAKSAIPVGMFGNVTPLVSTNFQPSGNGRSNNPNVIPCGDNSFFLLEGNPTSDIHASFFTINTAGVCTQQGSSATLSNCDETCSATSNGSDRMIVVGGENFNRIYNVYYNGSTVSASQLHTNGDNSGNPNMSTCTSLSDGTLLATVCKPYNGQRHYLYYGGIFPNGTTHTSSIFTDIKNGNSYGRAMGTSSGIYGFGEHQSNNDNLVSFGLRPYSGASQFVFSEHEFKMSGTEEQYGSGNVPFAFPTSGGVKFYRLDVNYSLHCYMVEENAGRMMKQVTGKPPSSGTRHVHSSNNALNGFFGASETFVRQANGTYMYFGSGSNPGNVATFSEDSQASWRVPFKYMAPLSTTAFTNTDNMSSAIVGNFLVRAYRNPGISSQTVCLDTYQFKG